MSSSAPTRRGAGIRAALAALRRRAWVVVACLLVIPGAVYAQTKRQPKLYRSEVVVQPVWPAGQKPESATLVSVIFDPTSIAIYARSPKVTARTYALLGPVSSAPELDASVSPVTDWVILTATGRNPAESRRSASAFERALGETVLSMASSEKRSLVRTMRQNLAHEPDPATRVTRSQALRQLRAEPLASLEQIQAAGDATVVSPHPGRNAALAFVLALLVAPGLVAAVEYFDRRVRQVHDLETLAGARVLATIPRRRSPRAPSRVDGGEDEAFRRLRDILSHPREADSLKSLVVVSPLPAEGRTTTAVGLARAFAQAGKRVVLVDADMRNGQLAHRLGQPSTPGLSDVLAGCDPRDALREVADPEGNLTLLPAGPAPADPAKLLGSASMSSLLDRLEDTSDLVVIDTPPLLVTSDALPLLGQASGVVALARIDTTPRTAVARMSEVSGRAGARLLGVVAIGSRAPAERIRSRRTGAISTPG